MSTGNAFGLIGDMTGTRASYDDWATTEADSLRDLARFLGGTYTGGVSV